MPGDDSAEPIYVGDQPDPQTALAEADRVTHTVRRHSRWYARYLVAFGIGMAAAVITLPLEGPRADLLWPLGWGVLIAAISVYAGRQRVCGRGLARRHLAIVGGCVVLFAGALVPGVTWVDNAWWWYAMWSPIVSMPALIGAYLEHRTGTAYLRRLRAGAD